MNWLEYENPTQASLEGVRILRTVVEGKPKAHLVLATGASPTELYALFAQAVNREGINCSRLQITCLDEWWGLKEGSAGTCSSYLREHVIQPWDCAPANFLSYEIGLSSPEAARDAFSARFAERGPADLCVLGIGQNGHLGLNEPAATFSDSVHVAKLAPTTRLHAMVSGLPIQPEQGITLGCGDIRSSKRVLVLADTEAKSEALAQLRKGIVSPAWPCTLLLRHSDATLLTWTVQPSNATAGDTNTSPSSAVTGLKNFGNSRFESDMLLRAVKAAVQRA